MEARPNQLAAQSPELRWRSAVLDTAVILGAVAGAATGAWVLTLFVGALKDATVAAVLFTTVGLAVVCTIGAIGMRAEAAVCRHCCEPQ